MSASRFAITITKYERERLGRGLGSPSPNTDVTTHKALSW